jgi:hypothetical protein
MPDKNEAAPGQFEMWIFRLSPAQTWAVAIACGVFVVLVSGSVDWLAFAQYIHLTLRWMITFDSLPAVVCVLLIHRLIVVIQASQTAHVRRLKVIGEMNHHIRNALEAIQMSAHYPQNDHSIEVIDRAVARIEWALREVLPREAERNLPVGDEPPI